MIIKKILKNQRSNQHNGQEKKRTNNNLQNIHIKLNIEKKTRYQERNEDSLVKKAYLHTVDNKKLHISNDCPTITRPIILVVFFVPFTLTQLICSVFTLVNYE